MCHVHYPNEMQHGNALICLAVHLFIGDPYFGLALRVALIPLGAGLRIGGWMADSKDLSLVMFFFMNEALCCFAFLLMLGSLSSKWVFYVHSWYTYCWILLDLYVFEGAQRF